MGHFSGGVAREVVLSQIRRMRRPPGGRDERPRELPYTLLRRKLKTLSPHDVLAFAKANNLVLVLSDMSERRGRLSRKAMAALNCSE